MAARALIGTTAQNAVCADGRVAFHAARCTRHVRTILDRWNLADNGYVIQRYVRLGLLVLAAGTFTAAALMPSSHVTAVRVTATAQSAMSAQQCADGKSLIVTFPWHGTTLTETDLSPTCHNGVAVGDPVTAYVQSNDATNVGPDANWILNPDTHNPFDFIGPNGLRGFIGTMGLLPLAAAFFLYLDEFKARRRATPAR